MNQPRTVLSPKKLGADASTSITPQQAAIAVGVTVGLAAVVVLSAPVWGGILVGAGAAALTNRAIQSA